MTSLKASPRRVRLSDAAVRSIKPPSEGRIEVADTDIGGLKLRVSSEGRMSWIVMRRVKGGAPVRVTIGTFPEITTAEARQKARAIVSEMASGTDPRERLKLEADRAMTLREALESYVDLRGARLKPSTVDAYRMVIETRCINLADRAVGTISGEDVVKWHQGFASRAVADHAARTLRAILRYAADRHNLVGPDGKVATEKLRSLRLYERPRRKERVIRRDRLPNWFDAVQRAPLPVCSLFECLALTGLRRDELRLAAWDQIDLDRGTLHLPDPKNRRPVTLPLPAQVVERLAALKARANSQFVFHHEGDGPVGLKTLWRWVERIAGEIGQPWSPHDLRRGYITCAAAMAPSYVVKRLAHHAEDAADVTSGYVRLDVESLRPWAQQVADKLLQGEAQVVAFPKGRPALPVLA